MHAWLKIGSRLALAVTIPILALVGFVGYDVAQKWQTRSEMAELEQLSEGIEGISLAAHELQRERGTSAAVLGSKGTQMRAELVAQRKSTDSQRSRVTGFLNSLRQDSYAAEFTDTVTEAHHAIAGLDRLRTQIDSLSITALESTASYSDLIAKLFAVAGSISKLSGRGDVTNAFGAYTNFMQGKERAGIERATGANGIATGRFEPQLYARIIMLWAAQDTYFGMFKAAAQAEQRRFFDHTMSGPGVENVTKMREIILAGGLKGELNGIDAKTWFDAATVRIDMLKTVEDRLGRDLRTLMQSIHDKASQTLIILSAIMLSTLIACSALVFAIGRGITRPVAALTDSMKELAAGNFAIALHGVDRRDELGEMARAVEAFKTKAAEKAQREAEEKEEREQQTAASRQSAIHKIADDFESAVGAIIETVSSASTELEGAATTLTGTAQTTRQLSTTAAASSEEASTNVQSVASASTEMAASINEISRQVQESSRISIEAVTQVEKTDGCIGELSEAAGHIGDVVKLITNIAEQTNLLALNATIEAARAGEAGRGFAVVAQEVKALATQTAKATGEIGAQISSMQAATRVSVAAIKEIGNTITRISEIASAIAGAVEQQGAATQEVARNIQQAATGTADAVKSIVDVSRGANETEAASEQVRSSAGLLAMEGTKLRDEVGNFLKSVRTGPLNRREQDDPNYMGPERRESYALAS